MKKRRVPVRKMTGRKNDMQFEYIISYIKFICLCILSVIISLNLRFKTYLSMLKCKCDI